MIINNNITLIDSHYLMNYLVNIKYNHMYSIKVINIIL